MQPTVDQPTANPTNKLTAATLASAIMAVLGLVLKNIWPVWYDPDVILALAPIVIFAAGYIIKDRPNT